MAERIKIPEQSIHQIGLPRKVWSTIHRTETLEGRGEGEVSDHARGIVEERYGKGPAAHRGIVPDRVWNAVAERYATRLIVPGNRDIVTYAKLEGAREVTLFGEISRRLEEREIFWSPIQGWVQSEEEIPGYKLPQVKVEPLHAYDDFNDSHLVDVPAKPEDIAYAYLQGDRGPLDMSVNPADLYGSVYSELANLSLRDFETRMKKEGFPTTTRTVTVEHAPLTRASTQRRSLAEATLHHWGDLTGEPSIVDTHEGFIIQPAPLPLDRRRILNRN